MKIEINTNHSVGDMVFAVFNPWDMNDEGSSAEVGSSIKITSGCIAMVRAIHKRCCWPPDKPKACDFKRSFTSSHNAAPRSDFSTIESMYFFSFMPWARNP